jgi:hypothetical protein
MTTHSLARRRSFGGPALTAASDRRDCLGQIVPFRNALAMGKHARRVSTPQRQLPAVHLGDPATPTEHDLLAHYNRHHPTGRCCNRQIRRAADHSE